MKYQFTLELSEDEVEDFELAGKNVMQVQIQLPNGEVVDSEAINNYCVILKMSPDAKIGFAKELIRSAIKGDKNHFEEINPVGKDSICQYHGVFLHPQSCKVLISTDDFGEVENTIT